MRNVVFISPKFAESIGGMETHAYEFVRHFSHDKDFPLHSILRQHNVEDGIPHTGKREDAPQNQLVKDCLGKSFEEDAEQILRLTRRENILYFLNSPTWAPVLPFLKKHNPKAMVVIRSGGNDLEAGWMGNETRAKELGTLKECQQRLVRLINENVNVLIVNSQYSFNRALHLGVRPDLMKIISGGVDLNTFKPPEKGHLENPQTVLTVARLVPFKGMDLCLRAFKRTMETLGRPLRYQIVGDGPEKTNLMALAHKLQISEYVDFMGAKPIWEIPDLFRSAYVYLQLPIHFSCDIDGSRYIHTETMGRTFCEAAACGLPMVASRVGGIPEMVRDRESGFLVEEGDVTAASEALITLLQDSNLHQLFANQARLDASNRFGWSSIFEVYRQLFREGL